MPRKTEQSALRWPRKVRVRHQGRWVNKTAPEAEVKPGAFFLTRRIFYSSLLHFLPESKMFASGNYNQLVDLSTTVVYVFFGLIFKENYNRWGCLSAFIPQKN